MAGLGYLAFYLAGKLALFDGSGHFWKQALFFAPFTGAALVAISRVTDYRHHWQDVLFGAGLGLFFAYFFYRQYYPRMDTIEPGLTLNSGAYRELRSSSKPTLEDPAEVV